MLDDVHANATNFHVCLSCREHAELAETIRDDDVEKRHEAKMIIAPLAYPNTSSFDSIRPRHTHRAFQRRCGTAVSPLALTMPPFLGLHAGTTSRLAGVIGFTSVALPLLPLRLIAVAEHPL